MSEINTKQIVQEWKEELKLEVTGLKEKGIYPKLTIIQDSQTQEECAMYRRNKHRVAEELGIESENVIINTESKSKGEIITLLKRELSEITNPVIVQMPFTNINSTDIANIIPYKLDVDGLSRRQRYLLSINDRKALVPATALGCMKLLNHLYDDLIGKTICIVNRSDLIGKPLIQLALNNNMTPIVCHSKTPYWRVKKYMQKSDIIITGCGKRKLFDIDDITNEYFDTMVETILDCSMAKAEGVSGVGDFDKESILKYKPNIDIASGFGHTGLLTTYCLFENVVKVYKNMLGECLYE